MVKVCEFCKKDIVWPDIFNCYYCQKTYCDKHSLAENHDCPKVVAARNIERDYLRKRGTNITTGRYMAVCKECGYRTGFMYIEEANQRRVEHIQTSRCSGSSVKLREHTYDRQADDDYIRR